MARLRLSLLLAAALLLAWWVWQSWPSNAALDGESAAEEAAEREARAAVHAPSIGRDGDARRMEEPPATTDADDSVEIDAVDPDWRVGVRMLRADGSPAAGVPVVFGVAALDPVGDHAMVGSFVHADAAGVASLSETDLANLEQVLTSSRAIYATAHFPYHGAPQVLFPLTREDLLGGDATLTLRAAGSIDVRLSLADGTPAPAFQATLQRQPVQDELVRELLRAPFAGSGQFGAEVAGEDGLATLAWIGVGVQGIVTAARPEATSGWTYGPLRDQDRAQLQLTEAREAAATLHWTFQLLDPAGQPARPGGSLMATLEIWRRGERWHRITAPVRGFGPQGEREVTFDPAPPLLEGDRVELTFRTLRERWQRLDVTDVVRRQQQDLGMLSLNPLPIVASGRVVDEDGRPLPNLTVSLRPMSTEPDPHRVPITDRPSGNYLTNEFGEFVIRAEADLSVLELVVHQTAFTREVRQSIAPGRTDWTITAPAR